jgi:hypothetical protein
MAGLKKALLNQPEQFVGTVAAKLLMYAIGRNIQYYDQPAIRAIVREAAAGNNTMESLVMGVVTSAPFQIRESTSGAQHLVGRTPWSAADALVGLCGPAQAPGHGAGCGPGPVFRRAQ